MREPNSHSGPKQNAVAHAPAPLFRPEALDAQQQKVYGEILLLRPLSLAFLAWLGAGLAALVAALFIWGAYTETAHVAGIVRVPPGRLEAQFDVPGRWISYVRTGERVSLRCLSCADPHFARPTGTVTEITPVMPDSSEAQIGSHGPLYRVVVALNGESKGPFLEGARLEAYLPLERQRLFNWIFSRPAS